MEDAAPVIEAFDAEFNEQFGRSHGGLLQPYQLDGAETVLLGMGSLMGAVCDVVDKLRDQGQAVGALRLRCFRPFPVQALVEHLGGA